MEQKGGNSSTSVLKNWSPQNKSFLQENSLQNVSKLSLTVYGKNNISQPSKDNLVMKYFTLESLSMDIFTLNEQMIKIICSSQYTHKNHDKIKHLFMTSENWGLEGTLSVFSKHLQETYAYSDLRMLSP
jgi:hypothetical protein